MIKGIHHIALVVRDIEGVLPYYRNVAGFNQTSSADALAISPDQDGAKTSEHHVLLAGPNAYLKLISRNMFPPHSEAQVGPIHQPGIRHFCLQNNDCTILEQAVYANKGSLIAPPLDLGTGNQYAYARDPEGNIMEIEGLPYAPLGAPTWMGHVAIVIRDMDAAVEFYSALFATEPNSRSRLGPGPQFDRMGGLVDAQIEGAWLPTGNILLELWQFHAPDYDGAEGRRDPPDPGYAYVCLETDALSQDLERLIALGGNQLSGITENDLVRAAFASDREGNVIQLLQFHESDGRLSIDKLDQPGMCALVDSGR
jgi:predicted enzyme related to lactoylglutathione lyase